MTKFKEKIDDRKFIRRVFLVLATLALFIAWHLHHSNVALFDPQGLIALQQHRLLILTTAILLLIAVPTLFFFYFFAWKYRETNVRAAYVPAERHSIWFVVWMWVIPTIFMLVLIPIMWAATHQLAPQKAISASEKPLTIQVIALRWKWLFIYPEQHIATVNFVQIPTGTPIQFELTADAAPMSSFWIPHLGGQLYAMTGHSNKLNLLASKPGDYPGSSAEINGAGFAGMKFIARASSKDVFDSWVKDVKANSNQLNSGEYQKLVIPSENNLVEFYNLAQPNLYDTVVMKYMEPTAHNTHSKSTEPQ